MAHTLSHQSMRHIVPDGFCPWVRGGCIACRKGRGGFRCGEDVYPSSHARRIIGILQLSFFLVSLVCWLFLVSMAFGLALYLWRNWRHTHCTTAAELVFSDSKAALLSAVSTETVISAEARECQALIWQLKVKHKQISLQWLQGHCQIAGNEHADALAKKGTKILQTHTREASHNIAHIELLPVKLTANDENFQISTKFPVI
jgi:hypothetical protein